MSDDNKRSYSSRELATMAGVTPRSIYDRARRLGITPCVVGAGQTRRAFYTEGEAEAILADDRTNGWGICPLRQCTRERTHVVTRGRARLKVCELCWRYEHAEGAEARALLLEITSDETAV